MLHIPILRHGKPYESIDKIEILHGVLKGQMVDILITDEVTASGILAIAERGDE